MRRRFGRRRIFSGTMVATLGIGALAIIALSMKRRATVDAIRELYGTAREGFGEARKREPQHAKNSSEHVSDNSKAEAQSTQAAPQEPTERAPQTRRERTDKVLAQDTEETAGSTREEIRRVADSVRLRSLSGQPLMRVIRASARRSRGGA